MAESDVYAKPPNLAPEQNQASPSKFHSHILYKVLTAIFFLVILPLVPSQAPEFINQTLLTRSWELLHLLFVGIAVSYGLFSRRSDDKEDEISVSKFDNVQSYVSGLLHVSSVFDDEPETPSANDESVSSSSHENKVQTWSNRYFRNESVVVAEERPVVNEERVRSEKPLLLPVRSLKSRVVVDDESKSKTVSGSKPRVTSRRSLSKLKRSSTGDFGGGGGVSVEETEDKLNENVVLRSPVPWRSRSGRMEVQEEADNNPPVYSPAAPMEESESNWLDSRPSRPQTSRTSRASANSQKPSPSPSPSPRKPSPSPTVSPELQAKSAEDLVRKKSFYRSPPPPPPPPPPSVRRISSMKPSSWLNDNEVTHQKDLKRSLTSKPRTRNTGDNTDMIVGASATANSSAEILPRDYVDNQSMGKSVRTTRQGEVVNEPPRRRRELGGNDQLNGKILDQDDHDQDSEENPIKFPDEDKVELVEKLDMETDDDDDMESEEEEDDMAGQFIREDNGEPFIVNRRDRRDRRDEKIRSSSNEEAGSSNNMANDGGPDVDKKADEFIAKFREQIRRQRIESIKRSSGQIRRNTSTQT